jgi:hypothetical protein
MANSTYPLQADDDIVGQLVLLRQEAQGNRAHWVEAEGLEQLLEDQLVLLLVLLVVIEVPELLSQIGNILVC